MCFLMLEVVELVGLSRSASVKMIPLAYNFHAIFLGVLGSIGIFVVLTLMSWCRFDGLVRLVLAIFVVFLNCLILITQVS